MNTCYKCETKLTDKNWSHGNKIGGIKTSNINVRYICKPCDNEKSRLYRLKNKKDYGYLYLVSNPAWQGWFKLGKCDSNYKNRLSSYNTSSPMRDFEFKYLRKCKKPRQLESLVWKRVEKIAESFNSEWFKVDLEITISIIESIKEEK